MMKRLLLDVPDDDYEMIVQVVNRHVLPYSPHIVLTRDEFFVSHVKADEESITSTPLEAPEPVEEPLNEAEVLSQCADLSKKLALLSKKKLINQRK